MKKINKLLLVGFVFLSGICLCAEDFGSQGHSFPIVEKDFFLSLEEKLKDRPLSETQKNKIQKIIIDKARHPTEVKFIREATAYRRFIYDPSVEAKENYRDLDGKIVVQAGFKVNPLDTITLTSGLLFIDGTNRDHIKWANSQKGEYKWILVKGSPIELEEREERPIYFDQKGVYSKRFNIKHIPCCIRQEGKVLVIEEIPIKSLSSVRRS